MAITEETISHVLSDRYGWRRNRSLISAVVLHHPKTQKYDDRGTGIPLHFGDRS
ncbi:hypothetical protein F7734_10390 [Scytonema sp. UIC 10036]|uniref:hypothetical protein n=1 Tax=Scytonema sp. UIC 10036 TaxID=2304196 RepID=UPI0012DA8434|nr:hypothetical protein [Scytonema sp. UIC 10036]MUG92834.1 hypothetical protein [Scytonema sp. UIC 10036]